MDKTDRLRDYGLAFLLYKQGLSVCGYELIRELFIFIKLILNSYLRLIILQAAVSLHRMVSLISTKIIIRMYPLEENWMPSCLNIWRILLISIITKRPTNMQVSIMSSRLFLVCSQTFCLLSYQEILMALLYSIQTNWPPIHLWALAMQVFWQQTRRATLVKTSTGLL